MTLRKFLLVFVVAAFAVLPAFAAGEGAEQAPKAFAEGKALLAKGDFDGAFKAFATAAKADPSNPEYKKQAQMVRRVVTLRKFVDKNEPSAKWNKMVLSLHVYYLRNEVYSEALVFDKAVHAKVKSFQSASMLAETLLELKKNSECIALLSGLDEKDRIMETRIPLAIALARTGKVKEAGAIAAKWQAPADADVGALLDFARMHALTGRHAACCRMMTKCLENSPPSQQKLVVDFVKDCGDFDAYKSCPEFAKVMQTKSKIKVSDCSAGSSCSTCPNRSGCGKKGSDTKDDCGSDGKDTPAKKK